MTTSKNSGAAVSLKGVIGPAFYETHRLIRAGKIDEAVEKGGRASLKSSYVSVEVVLQLLRHPDCHALVTRQVADTMRDSVYAQILWAIDKLGLGEKFRCTQSPLQCVYLPTGQRILFRGLDDPQKIKSIKLPFGYIGIVWFEEADQIKGGEEAVRNVQQSALRGGEYGLTFISFNPPAASRNWANRYARAERRGKFVHHSSYLQAPEKVVYIDSANLQVRGGISNERVMRQAAARFVENLQKAPYNLSAAEAKKALKEVSPLNSRTIDKALSIQNDLNPDLRRLLDEEFLNRAECETYLRLTLEEQARAAAVFLKIAALDPRSHERRAIKDALTTAMLDVAVERRSMQERESVFAAALQNAQDAIDQAKTQESKAAAVDKNHNFISAKLPTTARKLRKIAAAKNIEAKIRSYTAEDRKAMSDQMQELIAAAQELKALIDAVE